MTERNDVVYNHTGGYEDIYSPSEIGLGTDFDARALIFAEQERAKQQGQSWQRKLAAMPVGMSAEVHGGEVTIYNGRTAILVKSVDVAKLAQACATALNNQKSTSRY